MSRSVLHSIFNALHRREFTMFDRYPPKSVVVGVDGSDAAIRAARWAVDEVAGTDIPLRLLYVAKPTWSGSPGEARVALMAAEEVVHDACNVVAEVGKRREGER